VELEFTSDQEDLRASIRAVLTRECPIGLVREVTEKGVTAGALQDRMTELYWPALTIPEADGGMGLGAVELAVLAEELGRAVAPGPLFATLALFVPAVREVGTAEQRARFLGPVAEGTASGTLAVAGRGGRWDPLHPDVTARPDGDWWVLDGQAHYVLDAGRVDHIAVAARTDGGVSLLVVPAGQARVSPVRTLDATRTLATVDFGGVSVASDGLVGRPGGAAAGLARALEEATAALAADLVGTCSAIFEIALDYAKVREQFGVKIGSFQAMKHKLTDMFVALEAARAMAYFAAVAIAEDDERRGLAASMAKALAGDCERRVAQEGIQTLGGIGYTWEHDMHLYVKRAMSSAALLGTAEEHRQRVATLLGVTPSSPVPAAAP
jgi:alkylation response protein AidB-like acyl-CoA dehydrogenase